MGMASEIISGLLLWCNSRNDLTVAGRHTLWNMLCGLKEAIESVRAEGETEIKKWKEQSEFHLGENGYLIKRCVELENELKEADKYAKEQYCGYEKRCAELEAMVGELRKSLDMLYALVEHETNLPESARNGVTDPMGMIDEGIVMASKIINAADAALRLPIPSSSCLQRAIDKAVGERFKPLFNELSELLSDEDLDDEKLREASESLLPRLHDALLPYCGDAKFTQSGRTK